MDNYITNNPTYPTPMVWQGATFRGQWQISRLGKKKNSLPKTSYTSGGDVGSRPSYQLQVSSPSHLTAFKSQKWATWINSFFWMFVSSFVAYINIATDVKIGSRDKTSCLYVPKSRRVGWKMWEFNTCMSQEVLNTYRQWHEFPLKYLDFSGAVTVTSCQR